MPSAYIGTIGTPRSMKSIEKEYTDREKEFSIAIQGVEDAKYQFDKYLREMQENYPDSVTPGIEMLKKSRQYLIYNPRSKQVCVHYMLPDLKMQENKDYWFGMDGPWVGFSDLQKVQERMYVLI